MKKIFNILMFGIFIVFLLTILFSAYNQLFKGKNEDSTVTDIKLNLQSIQVQAFRYYNKGDTFKGLCGKISNLEEYAPIGSSQGYHPYIEPMINTLIDIVGKENIRCIVKTMEVPRDFNFSDMLEDKNFGVAVYYKERHYAVDSQGVMVLDTTDTGEKTSYHIATDRCAKKGKKLPSIEVLKAINDYGAQGGRLTFTDSHYISSTSYGFHAYTQSFYNGNILRYPTVGYSDYDHVRCAS